MFQTLWVCFSYIIFFISCHFKNFFSYVQDNKVPVNSQSAPPTSPSLVHRLGVTFTIIHIAIQLFLPYSHGITKVKFWWFIIFSIPVYFTILNLWSSKHEWEREREKLLQAFWGLLLIFGTIMVDFQVTSTCFLLVHVYIVHNT